MNINPISDNDLLWLAGLLEGEGWFCKANKKRNCPSMGVEMTDLDIIERVSKLFNRKIYKIKGQKEHYKDTYLVKLSGSHAVELMKRLKSLMGFRRQKQIQEAIDSYDPKITLQRWVTRTKLTSEKLTWAKENKQLSLRNRAKTLGVDHETLRQRLLKF